LLEKSEENIAKEKEVSEEFPPPDTLEQMGENQSA